VEAVFLHDVSLLVEATANGVVDLFVGDFGVVGDGGVEVVSFERPLLHEEEGNVGDIAVVDKVLKGVRPEDDADSPDDCVSGLYF
jgi:hypothetical protein